MELFISAVTHRTGSTLLQRICNARKKTLIWGEPASILLYYHNLYQQVSHFAEVHSQVRKTYFNNDEDPNCWIACMNPAPEYIENMIIASVKAGLKNLYDQYAKTHDIIGFKQVVCGEKQLNLFRKCYPEVDILLLVRNPLDVWKSASENMKESYYTSLANFTDIWKENTKFYIDLDKQDSNAYLVRYEDIIQKKDTVLNLISNLAKVSKPQINNVLDHKIGSNRSKIGKKEEQFILTNCEETMKLLNY